jgi:uncharacterized damage-inducible protein DinB
MLEQFQKNFEYNYWADDLFLKALAEMPNPPAKALELMGHLVFASDVWLARLQGEDLSRFTNPNPHYSLAECREKRDELHLKWKNYLTGLKPEDLQKKIVFANTKGKKFEHVVQNVLVHVVNHSHYHRGQLATLVHQNGGNRPYTDYMGYALFTGESKEL